jgi:hypothetical protein
LSVQPGSAGSTGGRFYTPRDSRQQGRANRWILAASFAYAVATAGHRWHSRLPAPLPWILTAIAALLILYATRFYVLFLRGADELLRKIQIEALAVGFGAGAVWSMLYPLLTGLQGADLGAQATTTVMMFGWGIASCLGTRRYSRGEA